jgi:hypothetical protein
LLESFLDKPDRSLILIFENTDSLNILTEFPTPIKSKIVCFVKRNATIIYNDVPLKKQIAIAEFTQSSMTQLSLFISEVDDSFSSNEVSVFRLGTLANSATTKNDG